MRSKAKQAMRNALTLLMSLVLALSGMPSYALAEDQSAGGLPDPFAEYSFDDASAGLVDKRGNSTATPFSAAGDGLGHANTSASFGSDSEGTYWEWHATPGTNPSYNGGGFRLLLNGDIGNEYTIGLKFCLNETGPGYKKIIDYKNYTSDTGFYFYGSTLTFYNYGSTAPSPTINDGTVVDLIAQRSQDGHFTVFMSDSDGNFDFDSPVLDVQDTSGQAIPSTVEDEGIEKTVLSFFCDDYIAEATTGGRVYSLKIWADAVDVRQVAEALDPPAMIVRLHSNYGTDQVYKETDQLKTGDRLTGDDLYPEREGYYCIGFSAGSPSTEPTSGYLRSNNGNSVPIGNRTSDTQVAIYDTNGNPTGDYATVATLDLYCVWRADVNVTFDADGGQPTPAAQTIQYGSTAAEPSSEPTKAGYKFDGWYEDGAQTAYNFSSAVEDDLALTAKWYQPTVTFDGNGSTAGDMQAQTVAYNTATQLTSNSFSRNGYEFLGWSEDASATEPDYEDGVNVTLTTDKTFFAVWAAKKGTISFNANEGTGATMEDLEVTMGEETTLSANTYERAGYEFLGWSKNANATSADYEDNSKATFTQDGFDENDRLNLYAVWVKVHNVTFSLDDNGQSGSEVPESQVVRDGSTATEPNPGPIWEHFDFKGWFLQDAEQAFNFDTTVTDDIELHAGWQREAYAITYVAEGGDSVPAAQEKEYGIDLTLSPQEPKKDPTTDSSYVVSFDANGGDCETESLTATKRTTYTFKNWLSSSDGVEYAAGSTYSNDAATTMTAQWDESTDGGSITLPSATAPDGFEFKGWATSADAAEDDVIEGTTYTPDGNVDLHAIYTRTKPTAKLALSGDAHVQKSGWLGVKTAGAEGIVIGTTGESRRLEAFMLSLSDGTDGGIEYRSHLQKSGWETSWASDGDRSGTTGQSRRAEAVQIRLTGSVATNHDVFYRVHSQTYGWLGWAKNGEIAGTSGMSKRAEAIQVCVLSKGQKPADYDSKQAAYRGYATGNAHLQRVGWTGSTALGVVGTTGQARRLEALMLTVPNQPYSGGIEYRSHLQGTGWEKGWRANGALSGTTGQSRRAEAVQIRLTGELAGHFSVWYRVHSQTYGWLGWARDGQVAGTTGLAKRAEAVEVVLLPKGASAPGATANNYIHNQ